METFLFGRIGWQGLLLFICVCIIIRLAVEMFRTPTRPTPDEQARQAKQEIRRIHRQARNEMMRAYMQRTKPPATGEVIEGEIVDNPSRRAQR